MDTATIAEMLQESPLFRGVKQADREALVEVMHRESYAEGETLFEKGSTGDSVYIILSGQILIYTDDAQGQLLTSSLMLRSFGPTQMFGEFSMLDQKPRSASAATAEPTEVLVLHRDDFLAFLEARPLVGLAMMRNLVERVRYTTTYLQTVMDATQQLSEGNFNEAVQDQMPESSTDAEIQKLIQVFVNMTRSVLARQQALQQPGTGTTTAD
ncbi:MAG: Crp/Fnr family transcriptional regulator [Anaerolineae bacterium]|jgi:CRP/FNR family cyclic AMP-dependent transcriptional regulator|nr:Crp/Fnr family transcriptional regulator [Anaerolineae bacterium]